MTHIVMGNIAPYKQRIAELEECLIETKSRIDDLSWYANMNVDHMIIPIDKVLTKASK